MLGGIGAGRKPPQRAVCYDCPQLVQLPLLLVQPRFVWPRYETQGQNIAPGVASARIQLTIITICLSKQSYRISREKYTVDELLLLQALFSPRPVSLKLPSVCLVVLSPSSCLLPLLLCCSRDFSITNFWIGLRESSQHWYSIHNCH